MIYAIGDIHGHLKQLEYLIDGLPYDKKNDLLVFLGDYIDRGPDSKGVIDYLINLNENSNCMFVRGNHEEMMLDTINNPVFIDLWIQNGGYSTLNNYDNDINNIPDSHLKFLKSTVYMLNLDKYIFVHAGINPDFPINEQITEDILWIRDKFLHAPKLPTDKIIVHGHTPINYTESIYNGIDRICVDNGVCLGFLLIAIRLEDQEKFYAFERSK